MKEIYPIREEQKILCEGIMIPCMILFDTKTKETQIVVFGEDKKPRAYVQVPTTTVSGNYGYKIEMGTMKSERDDAFVLRIIDTEPSRNDFFFENHKPFTEEDFPVMKANLERELKERGER